ncbi:class I adenylate-forming enzyme family protein [Marinimicrococcus flavescens]|uniref:AMP-binding protein n=1 Tax=Marinimicrococcus flavescens TaxID=3031815 RepID=A0AAP3UY81_9PROT|nr:AMP-binding protein [Marinimicrococcus flavescens]
MNVADHLTRHAAERPCAVAAIHRDRLVRYGELDTLVWRMAAALRTQGLGPGDRVGVTVRQPVLHLVAMLALARLGAVQMGLAASEPVERRRSLAGRLRLAAVLVDQNDAAQGAPALMLDPAWLKAGAVQVDRSLRNEGGDGLLMIAGSSGTTGAGKLYAVSHSDELVRAARDATVFGWRPAERYLNLVDLHFAVGRRRVLHCLVAGGCVFLPPGEITWSEIAEAIDRHAVTHVSCTPVHATAMLEHLPSEQPRFPDLRVLRVGAAAVPEALRAQIRRRLTPNLYINYGSNEGGTIAGADPALQRLVPGTVGRPMAGLEVEVVDADGRPLPAGETGQVRLRGPGVIREYLDDPEATALAFRDGWFHPGDLACFTAEGALLHHGRADDVMVFDGINIHPGEIEQVLLEHEAVVEAAAFGLASQRHQHVPAAAVVLRRPVGMEVLIRFCRERLGVRAPRRLFSVESLPRNATGKILRREIAVRLGGAARAD